MKQTVITFRELRGDLRDLAGGKGKMLAKMVQEGYPVPDGFIILPAAFQNEKLAEATIDEIRAGLSKLRKQKEHARFAVRSSALSEDSARASFAGEFETVLDVKTDEEVLDAVYTVFQSGKSERVKVYSFVQGMDELHQLAVIVQLMVQPEISGVLFTADPITGSRQNMIGNYVHGLGEQLVSGEANPVEFKLGRPGGTYQGPAELKKYSRKLYRYAASLEKRLGLPQDLEWAVADKKLVLLQARPITTLSPGNLDRYEINDSLTGDELWVNTNVGEAVPDVVTPFTWSLIRILDQETTFNRGYYVWSGNICGRIYTNLSRRVSAYTLFGIKMKSALKLSGTFFGQVPEKTDYPVYPFSYADLFREILPKMFMVAWKMARSSKNMTEKLQNNAKQCKELAEKIKKAGTRKALLDLWKDELKPFMLEAWWMHGAGSSRTINYLRIKKRLEKLVGEEDSNLLLSNLGGTSGLASLGPVASLSKISKGEMSKEEYITRYGHRGPHELELSMPDPAEDDAWIEKQLADFENSGLDVEEMLRKQHARYKAALNRFRKRYPDRMKWLEKQLQRASKAASSREAARSEFTRAFRINRAFARRAGELSGLGDDIFFLYIHEVVGLLSGTEPALKQIRARKENYEKYRRLPPFPTVIRGRFDPFSWIKDPDRRLDVYDASMPDHTTPDDGSLLTGFAGSAGKAEGMVRVLDRPEDGDLLQPGEILVTASTNIGWTPLFPKASAIVTDIGAPLSHAAIVAREMGIPAVIGCGNATTRLATGDRVVVDGGQGTIRILEKSRGNKKRSSENGTES
ncbi:MAG: PEP/pyruvate-binding domain-containing protein [Thermoactinomyces sp.]